MLSECQANAKCYPVQWKAITDVVQTLNFKLRLKCIFACKHCRPCSNPQCPQDVVWVCLQNACVRKRSLLISLVGSLFTLLFTSLLINREPTRQYSASTSSTVRCFHAQNAPDSRIAPLVRKQVKNGRRLLI